MRITIFPCGVAVNESELLAIEHLRHQLQIIGGTDEWILLTNLAFSVTHQFQSDEVDLIAIGPPGVRVIEVKHWSTNWVDSHADLVEQECDKLTTKAKKIGTTLRRVIRDLSRVDGTILLTRPPSSVKKLNGRHVRGVKFHSLNQWKDAIGFDGPHVLMPQQIRSLGHALEPKSRVAVDGSLRQLAGYVNLELQTPKDERFHRIYNGSHPVRRDKVVLHLYDLSAGTDKHAEAKAKREADALQRLQLFPWAPRILDSWQDAPGYAGEMFFFTVVDPAAPCIEERESDAGWSPMHRLMFARDAVRTLRELHEAGESDEPMIHRNLTPQTILVRHDNSPILSGFDRTRIPSDVSVGSSTPPVSQHPQTVAPEVQAQGLVIADQRSDVYSLCASLNCLFAAATDGISAGAREILTLGLADKAEERTTLDEIDTALSELLGDSVAPPPPPPARFWTEDQTIRFHGGDYRIVARLGSGGVGTAFKVVQIDRDTKEELGTYVAKIAHEASTGQRILRSYGLARPRLGRHEALSPIHEFPSEWQENQFVALLGWIDGTPLSELTGVFELLAEDQNETTPESLAIRWLRLICEALDVLHRGGLTHGDVSPRNLIVSGAGLVLTDYDFVTRIGEPPMAPGTINYCSIERSSKRPSTASDDLYSLAASFFHVLSDKEPFRHGGTISKEQGLNWEGIDCSQYAILRDVLDAATHPDLTQRFTTAAEMLKALARHPDHVSADGPPTSSDSATFETKPSSDQSDSVPDTSATTAPTDSPPSTTSTTSVPAPTKLSEQHVPWLKSLLQSYPGSRWGNQETRGLDSEFAKETYVTTPLEDSLLEAIEQREVRLIILCGNAGDGKTALLQHLAQELGLGRHSSSERILEGRVKNGPRVRMNLDGSAAWQGKSADELLDDFLGPFQNGAPKDDIVHLLAVNDGRLLEWLEGVEDRLGRETALTTALYQLLQPDYGESDASHIRFISLNERSLVGGIPGDHSSINTAFLDMLIDQLYGTSDVEETWTPCLSCSAKERCRVFEAGRLFGPAKFPAAQPSDVRKHARQRLFEALQAVHLRGETHITVRELRAALVYILFGVHYCDDYHEGVDATLPFWDRAFAADSPSRQGEVLRELARFDPALEANPQVDRYLLSRPVTDSSRTVPHFEGLLLESARRRAFFEWSPDDIEKIAGDIEALGLARGRHVKMFRDLPLAQKAEELDNVAASLCAGISRLEDLPPEALDREGVVPLRITPRTPTETAFWVEKPLASFRLEADLPPEAAGIERLHRQVNLVYQYRDGQEERLRLGAELFHLLLELADGYQLGDVSTDDTFSHLSIFVQRLVREDERRLLAWNPMDDRQVYEVSSVVESTDDGPLQQMVLTKLHTGDDR